MSPNQPEVRENGALNPAIRYEPSQPNLRVVVAFLAALGLASLMVLVVLWGVFVYFRRESAKRGPLPSPRTYTSPPSIPQPQLQRDPVADYNVYNLSAEETLRSYGWVDQQAGIARLPIDKAMDLVVEHGLPWQAPGTGPAPTAPNPNPAEGPMPGASRGEQDLSRTRN